MINVESLYESSFSVSSSAIASSNALKRDKIRLIFRLNKSSLSTSSLSKEAPKNWREKNRERRVENPLAIQIKRSNFLCCGLGYTKEIAGRPRISFC